MALKLSLKKSTFPVEIEGFKFEVDLSDGRARDFEEKMVAFLKSTSELSEAPDSEERFAILLEDVFDELLGAGAYEKLYDYAKRLDLLAELLEELVLGLLSKLPGRSELVNAIQTAKQANVSD